MVKGRERGTKTTTQQRHTQGAVGTLSAGPQCAGNTAATGRAGLSCKVPLAQEGWVWPAPRRAVKCLGTHAWDLGGEFTPHWPSQTSGRPCAVSLSPAKHKNLPSPPLLQGLLGLQQPFFREIVRLQTLPLLQDSATAVTVLVSVSVLDA